MTIQTNKICKKCESVKPLPEFHKDAKAKDGLMSACKQCRNAGRVKFISHPDNKKQCWKCKETKSVSEFGVDNSRFDKLSPRCKPCLRKALKESANRNPETSKRKWAKRYSRNSEKIKQRMCAQQIQRIKTLNYVARSEKKCRVCQTIKSISDFTRHARTADGFRYECAECRKNQRQTLDYKIQNSLNKQRRRAREKNAEGSHKAEDIKFLYYKQSGKCLYCEKELEKTFHLDHIIPLSRGGSNWKENLQILCPTCNMRKSNKTPEEYFSIYSKEILISENKKAAL